MKYEKFLPIGTVVLLKGAKKKVMITGFCIAAEQNKEKVYDYAGCMYPEGFISSNQTLLFDHNQIDKIYCLGYSDEEEKKFKIRLNDVLKKMEQNKKSEQ